MGKCSNRNRIAKRDHELWMVRRYDCCVEIWDKFISGRLFNHSNGTHSSEMSQRIEKEYIYVSQVGLSHIVRYNLITIMKNRAQLNMSSLTCCIEWLGQYILLIKDISIDSFVHNLLLTQFFGIQHTAFSDRTMRNCPSIDIYIYFAVRNARYSSVSISENKSICRVQKKKNTNLRNERKTDNITYKSNG